MHIPETHAAILTTGYEVATTGAERRPVHRSLVAAQGKVPGDSVWHRRGVGGASGGGPIGGGQRPDMNGGIVEATGDVVCGECRTVHAVRGTGEQGMGG